MYKDPSKKLFIALIGIILISGCSGKSKKDDFDLSGFIKPIKKISQNNDESNKSPIEKKEIQLKLIPLANREEISSSVKYGKINPFSVGDNESNKLIENFKLKGFISFKNNDYALVEYQNEKGFINLNSVGGLNTQLLPKKVFVKEINPAQEIINLSIDGEILSINLDL